MSAIKYRDGYKYQLHEDYKTVVSIRPSRKIIHPYITLDIGGTLSIKAGYAWDGCSGPTWDDKTNMRAGLVHDSLFQLMREGLLDLGWRQEADRELYRICKEDGMWQIRAWTYYKAVRAFGESSAAWQSPKVLTAP
jgi:hypothetical protein